ncbi:MAG: glycosyltransferase family 87 protein [Candidatus Sulfotelmatobacter sp.]
MLRSATTRQQRIAAGARTFVLFILLGSLLGFAGARQSAALQGTDFIDFYAAARMLADGHGHQLYDANAQRQYQARYSGRVGTLYIHPPFEAVVYLAVAWLPLKAAYLLWWVLNFGFLALATRHLAAEVSSQYDWRTLFAAALTFVPVLLCLLQGQDSLFLLLFIVFALTALRRGRAFGAGCWLALGLFKFQLTLPIFLLLLISQSRPAKSSLVKGFGLVALALAAISVAISGWSVFTAYSLFLDHLPEQRFAGIFPQAMANFRGLLSLVFPVWPSAWIFGAATILSVIALLKALADWRRTSAASLSVCAGPENFDVPFASTVMFALLVSYHLNPHDLSLLLLPFYLLLNHDWKRTSRPRTGAWWMRASLLASLFLPPLHLLALRAHFYSLLSIPLLMLFLMGGSQNQATTIK